MRPSNLEDKSFLTSLAGHDDVKGEIEAIVSVFDNTDRGREIVRRGAFSKSLQGRTPKGVLQHDWKRPIARTLEARELEPGDPTLPAKLKDLGGLYIRGQFNLDTVDGRETYSNIKFGILDEFSIGYRVVRDSYDEKADVRELHEVELFEWSPVLVGMNDATSLLSLKSSEVPATFANQAESVLAYVTQLADRAKSLAELRAKEGRMISAPNRNRIASCVTSMRGVADDLDELLHMADPPEKAAEADVRAVYAEFLQRQIPRRT